MTECLYHFLSFDHLIDKCSLLAADFGLHMEITIRFLCDKTCHYKAERCDAHNDERDRHIDIQHKTQCSEDRQNSGKKLGKSHQKSVCKLLYIGDHTADQISGRMCIQIRNRQSLDLGDRCISQVTTDIISDLVIADTKDPLGDRRHGSRCHDHPYDRRHTRKIYFSDSDHMVNSISGQDWHIELGCNRKSGKNQTAYNIKPVFSNMFPDSHDHAVSPAFPN